MKILRQTQFIFAIAIMFSLLLYSCTPDPISELEPEEENYEVKVTPTNANALKERNLTIDGADVATDIVVTVKFESEEKREMKRMYITKYSSNSEEGVVPFVYTGAKTKKDGSIDLTGEEDENNISATIAFPTPSEVDETVVYQLWVTETKISSRGDFRDPFKRNAIGNKNDMAVATITINSGGVTGSSHNVSTDKSIKHFNAILLNAPLQDGSSKTFISMFNNVVYKINEGEEYASLWDFGYFYGATKHASFASAYEYPSDIINVPKIASVDKSELNKFYFRLSNKTAKDFDDVKNADQITFTAPTKQIINGLKVGNVVEFKDNYGTPGLIKILEIKGTYGHGDYIKFEVKMKK